MLTFARRVGAAFLTVAALVALTPSAAHATPNSPYRGQCGSGYGVIDWRNLGTYAVAYLTWNNNTGRNCMVTQRNTIFTTTTFLTARIGVYGGVHRSDSGNYYSHAGPVYVYAVNQCINWAGSAYGYSFAQNRVHCG
jgi:hypothetical protein